jgi:hypothetical protein
MGAPVCGGGRWRFWRASAGVGAANAVVPAAARSGTA